MKHIAKILLGFSFVLGSMSQGHAQSILASSTIEGAEIGTSGTYDYTLTLTAQAGSESIGSYWFAWTPGNFYLSATPSAITGNDGWSGSAVGDSIQFVGGSSIPAGSSVTFGFESTTAPSALASEVSGPHSVVYSGGIESGASQTIGVQSVPEPSVTVLSVLGGAVLVAGAWRKRFA